MPHTLLLADDSVTIQRVIELTFADEDVRVIAVGDGRQAITRIGHEPPDIVLADVGMPECDGYEVSAFVKGRADLKHIPVLLLTGAFEPVDEIRVLDVGADGVLAKPFEPQELIARVKELLGVGGAPPAGVAEAGGGTADAGRERALGGIDAAVETPPVETGEAPVSPHPASSTVSLDDYFDRLDAAFASLSAPSRSDDGAAPQAAEAADTWPSASASARVTPVAHPPEPAATGQAAPIPVKPMTPAEAFAAFLDAEQTAPQASQEAAWLGNVVLASAFPSVDDLVDTVARRVIDQLTGKEGRESVSEIVSTIAERLIREEIDRLKASIT
jgi:CheY-like chemotaxis protein